MVPPKLKPNLIEAAELDFQIKVEEIIHSANSELGRAQVDCNSRRMIHSTGFQQVVFRILREATYKVLTLRGQLDFETLSKSKQELDDVDLQWLLESQEKALRDFKKYLGVQIEHLSQISNFIPNSGKYLAEDGDLKDTIDKARNELKAKFLRFEKLDVDAAPEMPSISHQDFSFIVSIELKAIVERDIKELNSSIASKSFKSIIIMAGSVIEALLLDKLATYEAEAKAAISKSEPLEKWTLENLIDASYRLSVVNGDVERFSHAIRGYRNLIHPGLEVRRAGDITVNPHTAQIAVQVLQLVIRCLDKESNA